MLRLLIGFLISNVALGADYRDLINAFDAKDYYGLIDLLAAGVDPNLSDLDGNTLMYHAASEKNLIVASILVNFGGSVNWQNNRLETPLHWAVSGGSEEFVCFLLRKGSRKDIKDSNCETPLMYARVFGREQIIRILR